MSTIRTLTEAEFETEVTESTGTVMVELGAEWCGPCKAFEPIMEKVAAEADFKVFKIDVDDCPELCKKLGVRGIPMVIIFKNGKVDKQQVGLTTKDTLLRLGSV